MRKRLYMICHSFGFRSLSPGYVKLFVCTVFDWFPQHTTNFLLLSVSEWKCEEQKLMRKLFKHYERSVRPRWNSSETVLVNVRFSLQQINDLVRKQESRASIIYSISFSLHFTTVFKWASLLFMNNRSWNVKKLYTEASR